MDLNVQHPSPPPTYVRGAAPRRATATQYTSSTPYTGQPAQRPRSPPVPPLLRQSAVRAHHRSVGSRLSTGQCAPSSHRIAKRRPRPSVTSRPRCCPSSLQKAHALLVGIFLLRRSRAARPCGAAPGSPPAAVHDSAVSAAACLVSAFFWPRRADASPSRWPSAFAPLSLRRVRVR
eukprot:6138738-Prymnesium_polylepis.1